MALAFTDFSFHDKVPDKRARVGFLKCKGQTLLPRLVPGWFWKVSFDMGDKSVELCITTSCRV